METLNVNIKNDDDVDVDDDGRILARQLLPKEKLDLD